MDEGWRSVFHSFSTFFFASHFSASLCGGDGVKCLPNEPQRCIEKDVRINLNPEVEQNERRRCEWKMKNFHLANNTANKKKKTEKKINCGERNDWVLWSAHVRSNYTDFILEDWPALEMEKACC